MPATDKGTSPTTERETAPTATASNPLFSADFGKSAIDLSKIEGKRPDGVEFKITAATDGATIKLEGDGLHAKFKASTLVMHDILNRAGDRLVERGRENLVRKLHRAGVHGQLVDPDRERKHRMAGEVNEVKRHMRRLAYMIAETEDINSVLEQLSHERVQSTIVRSKAVEQKDDNKKPLREGQIEIRDNQGIQEFGKTDQPEPAGEPTSFRASTKALSEQRFRKLEQQVLSQDASHGSLVKSSKQALKLSKRDLKQSEYGAKNGAEDSIQLSRDSEGSFTIEIKSALGREHFKGVENSYKFTRLPGWLRKALESQDRAAIEYAHGRLRRAFGLSKDPTPDQLRGDQVETVTHNLLENPGLLRRIFSPRHTYPLFGSAKRVETEYGLASGTRCYEMRKGSQLARRYEHSDGSTAFHFSKGKHLHWAAFRSARETSDVDADVERETARENFFQGWRLLKNGLAFWRQQRRAATKLGEELRHDSSLTFITANTRSLPGKRSDSFITRSVKRATARVTGPLTRLVFGESAKVLMRGANEPTSSILRYKLASESSAHAIVDDMLNAICADQDRRSVDAVKLGLREGEGRITREVTKTTSGEEYKILRDSKLLVREFSLKHERRGLFSGPDPSVHEFYVKDKGTKEGGQLGRFAELTGELKFGSGALSIQKKKYVAGPDHLLHEVSDGDPYPRTFDIGRDEQSQRQFEIARDEFERKLREESCTLLSALNEFHSQATRKQEQTAPDAVTAEEIEPVNTDTAASLATS